MHDDEAATSLDESADQMVGLFDHQVSFERHRNRRTNRSDHVWPEREIWHEAAVHHVELNSIHTGFLQRMALVAQTGEIGRKHRGNDLDGGCGTA